MLIDMIYTGIKICALASVCAYGWIKVRQEREAAKTACKNCCYCRMVRTDGRVVCELEEKPIEQPASCPLFTKWPKEYEPSLCVYCKHCQTYGEHYVRCDVDDELHNKAKVTCSSYEKRRQYFTDLKEKANNQGAFIQVQDEFGRTIVRWQEQS